MALSEKELRTIIRQIRYDEDRLTHRVRRMLLTAREDVLSELGREPSKWREIYLRELLDRVDDRILRLRQDFMALANEGIGIAIAGGLSIGTSAIPASAPQMMVGIDPQLLRQLADYRADLIKNVTGAAQDKITEIVRRAMLTGKSLLEVEKEVGKVLIGGGGSGIFKSIAARAELIVQQEYNSLLNTAAFEGVKKSAELIPNLLKRWLTAGDERVRPAHVAANGQTVPWNEPFIVGGERLMYPTDRAGSPGNVMRCRCKVIPEVPDETS